MQLSSHDRLQRTLLDATVHAALRALRAARSLNPVLSRLHSRAGDIVEAFGRSMGLLEMDLEHLWWGMELHDIGLMAIPPAVVEKTSALTRDERAILREYPLYGARVLEEVQAPQEVVDIVRGHTEHWDGGGYPLGLTKDNNPRLARIASLVDSYDAMTTPRWNERALDPERVLHLIWRSAGHQFDPQLAERFLQFCTGELRAKPKPTRPRRATTARGALPGAAQILEFPIRR
ncbi:MAG TPA: HD domain-containing phosphohydrolase [bacterium]|nr:HD domain-containing phosphohydrolase [bacterium]